MGETYRERARAIVSRKVAAVDAPPTLVRRQSAFTNIFLCTRAQREKGTRVRRSDVGISRGRHAQSGRSVVAQRDVKELQLISPRTPEAARRWLEDEDIANGWQEDRT